MAQVRWLGPKVGSRLSGKKGEREAYRLSPIHTDLLIDAQACNIYNALKVLQFLHHENN